MSWYTDNGFKEPSTSKKTTSTKASTKSTSKSSSSGSKSSGQVTDMTKWYNETKASQGSKPTADQVSQAMSSYRDYVAGKTSSTSGDIWNTYGEKIGNTGTGTGGHVDFSKSASNAIVDPTFVKTADNDYEQRVLTSTNGSEPGFIDYKKLPQLAENWLKENPGSDWDKQSLVDLWKSKYGDVSGVSNAISRYADKENIILGNQPISPNANSQIDTVINNNISKPVNNSVNTTSTTIPSWQQNLEIYKTDPQAGLNEIARAQQVWKDKTAAGDTEGAEKAHQWANMVRDAIGVSGQYDSVTGAPLNNNVPTTETTTSVLEEDTQMQEMQKMIEEQKQAFIQQQEAKLQAARDQKIAELEKAYNQAIADGQISINDAQNAFNTQKAEIEKQAYLASQKIKLYASNMGIQNSQQMIGLMQGNDARVASLNNANMTERDKKIADIKTRLNAIKQNKELDISTANSVYNSGVLEANATAEMNASNNMFDLAKTDYTADRNEAFQLKTLEIQQNYALQRDMAQSKLKIQEMYEAGKIDAQQADVAWQRTLQELAIKHGYSMAEIASSAAGKASSGSNSYLTTLMRTADAYGINYSKMTEAQLAKAVKNAQDKEGISKGIKTDKAKADYIAAQKTLSQGKPVAPKKPITYNSKLKTPLDWIQKTTYDKEKAAYDSKMQAYQRALKLVDSYK